MLTIRRLGLKVPVERIIFSDMNCFAMIVQFSRWGNSLAVRIPSNVLKDVGAREGTSAELSVISGKVVLNPILNRPSYTLSELLAGITEENLHEEVDFGPPVGSETW